MYISRLMLAAMAVVLTIIVGAIFVFAQTGDLATGGAGPAAPAADVGAGQTAGVGPGPNTAAAGAGNAPVQSNAPAPGLAPISRANDAARMANAKRVQMAVAVFYAENDRYPQSLAEIPVETLGFEADPGVYRYAAAPNSGGFRLEVALEGNAGGDPNVVTEGGVTKYVYVGQ